MFTKLTKYEWIAISRLMVPLYLIFCILTLTTRFIFSLNIMDGRMIFLPYLFFVLFMIGLIVMMTATFILTIFQFYKNLMTGEGYLMFTLPVNVHQLILSKLLVSTLCFLGCGILCIAALFIVLPSATVIDPELKNFTLSYFIDMLTSLGAMRILLLCITILFLILLNILSFYASISIGQMICQNKIIGSFLAYLGIYTLYQCVGGLIIFIVYLFDVNFNNPDTAMSVFISFGLITGMIGSAFLYRLTSGILKKRLNLT